MTAASTRRVVIDTDTGIDDALAVIYLAASEGVEIVACTTTFGNCSTAHAIENVSHVLRLCGLDEVPVHPGREGPISGEPAKHSWFVHGHDGLGDQDLDRVPATPSAESAADALVRLGRENPGELDLLVLGAQSNIADAVAIDPDVLTRYRSVVIMGGSGPYAEPGDVMEVDANVAADPQAAAVMFGAPRAHMVMVGVNVTTPTIMDEEFIARLGAVDAPIARFSHAVTEAYLDFYQEKWGRRICAAHDGLAAGVMIHPELVRTALRGPVNVRSDGFATRARLMRTVDDKPTVFPYEDAPETVVVTEVDHAAFLADFLEKLVTADERLGRGA
ncbi:nucleoside hydrolase [Actinoplanes sp. NPDC051851]|uniref:nucleoside hydrolase n=1 Tax=Actinoplanes sp. NPDC051851 TaxID=3154753 RepID=UPI00341B46E1